MEKQGVAGQGGVAVGAEKVLFEALAGTSFEELLREVRSLSGLLALDHATSFFVLGEHPFVRTLHPNHIPATLLLAVPQNTSIV